MLSRSIDQCKLMIQSGVFDSEQVRDAPRVCGDNVCGVCGHKYYDHPQHVPYYFLNVICDGTIVKL